jgi:putative ABC transport system permease protein
MHMASSFVWDWKAEAIAAMPGVRRVTPILYLNSVYRVGDRRSFGYVVGLQPGDGRAGPWEMTAGRTVTAAGETVIPAALARLAGASLGDPVTIADRRFEVVGLSGGTYSAANTIIFVTMADLEDMLSLAGAYSFLLVDADDGVDAGALAARIRTDVDKVNAVTQEEFIRNDFAMAMQMGVEIIFLMTLISSVLAALIVAFTASALVMRARRELAVAKALGARSRSILAAVVLQATVVTLVGCAIAMAFTLFVMPWIPAFVPQLTLALSMATAARVAVIAVFVAAAGAILPGALVAAVDPATAFHR